MGVVDAEISIPVICVVFYLQDFSFQGAVMWRRGGSECCDVF